MKAKPVDNVHKIPNDISESFIVTRRDFMAWVGRAELEGSTAYKVPRDNLLLQPSVPLLEADIHT